MIGCLRTHVHKQPIIVLYFKFETVLKIYNLWACTRCRWGTKEKEIYKNLNLFATLQSFQNWFEKPIAT